MNPKKSMNESATNVVKSQSMFLTNPPRADAGSCGRGVTGGATTNWKSTVVSPTTILPRDVSVSFTCQKWPALRAAPDERSCSSS